MAPPPMARKPSLRSPRTWVFSQLMKPGCHTSSPMRTPVSPRLAGIWLSIFRSFVFLLDFLLDDAAGRKISCAIGAEWHALFWCSSSSAKRLQPDELLTHLHSAIAGLDTVFRMSAI